MEKFTSKDLEEIREYRDKLKTLTQEEPKGKLTAEEWDEAMQEIHKTGRIPSKYEGRIQENETIVYSEIVKGKHKAIPEGKKVKTYIDVVANNYDIEYGRLNTRYHDLILRILGAYFANKDIEGAEKEALNKGMLEVLSDILEDPEIRRELEKEAKAKQLPQLPPLGSVPNGDSINWLYRVVNASKGGRLVEENEGNRHEKITTIQKGDSLKFTRENKQNGSTLVVEISQADKYLSKTNKTFTKALLFTLQKMTAQNFPLEVGFSLQELVDLGMYSTTSNANRAIKEFFNQQKQTTLSGTVKKGKKTVSEEGGVLFYHYRIKNGYVTLSVNENFNMEFIANYFTVFPRFAYALSNNAFSLVRYIFFLARQNTKAIKEKGTFTISLEAVRENLGLPSVEEVKNRRYRQLIIEPIETAIEEIEKALETVPEAKEYGFTITLCGTETTSIKEWLQGFLEIGLRGDFAETFVRIATKAEQDREKWEKIKTAELAKIAARNEAKEAKGK